MKKEININLKGLTFLIAIISLYGCTSMTRQDEIAIQLSDNSKTYPLSETFKKDNPKYLASYSFAYHEPKDKKSLKPSIIDSLKRNYKTQNFVETSLDIYDVNIKGVKSQYDISKTVQWDTINENELDRYITKSSLEIKNFAKSNKNYKLPLPEPWHSDESVQDMHPWDKAHLLTENINIEQKANGEQVFSIAEPNFISMNIARNRYDESTSLVDVRDNKNINNVAKSAKGPSKVWASGNPLWHKDGNYSQLNASLKVVKKMYAEGKPPVKIAHLDTGYNALDKYRPENLNQNESIDFANGGECGVLGQYISTNMTKPSHGSRMLSVLAGREIKYKKQESGEIVTTYIGGDPLSEVVEYRIANKSVVHFSNKKMVKAIRCAIENEIDVISLSAGGFPSIAQRNVINDAYDEGVAIFAATGDFFDLPLLNINILGTSIGYPARYSRVIGVAGMTKDGESYGKSPSLWKTLDWKFWQIPGHIANWSMRGSYGPAYAMEDHVISGWGPNVTHSYSMGENQLFYRENGAGTSSTTPQAAAAASLWLNHKYNEFTQSEWRSWKKAEAVYQSMIRAANDAIVPEQNYTEMFGEGPLKAMDMLDISYKNELKKELVRRKPSRIGFRWIYDTLQSSNFIKLTGIQKNVHIEMIVTELMQNITILDKYSRTYNTVLNYRKNQNKKAKEALLDLLNMLEKEHKNKYSKTLTSAIKELKKELETIMETINENI